MPFKRVIKTKVCVNEPVLQIYVVCNQKADGYRKLIMLIRIGYIIFTRSLALKLYKTKKK